MVDDLNVSVQEVEQALKNGSIRLIDVRTEAEYAVARIEGAQLLTPDLAADMAAWPKDTAIVLHCHHGIRSLDAAAYFVRQGFTRVRSMAGGIEAWSCEIDPTVPRY